jgi:crossover junction endodeoxyribonuclease RuvC
MSSVLGIDPSLCSTGYAYAPSDRNYICGRIQTKHLRGCERLFFIKQSIETIIHTARPTLIAYEGYAMGVRNGYGKTYDIGELGGVLKLLAFEKRIKVLLVPPTSLKMFACGNGRAQKSEVIAAVAATWNRTIKSDDEADAFILLKMGQSILSRRKPRSLSQKVALRGCLLLEHV